MKHSRELRVGILAVICAGLLYFGFNFLKGINIFSPTKGYVGYFEKVPSLTEQSPVFIRGYKVGLVEAIAYDFTRDSAFTVTISIDDDIRLPKGTQMALVPNGLLSGTAIELLLPASAEDGYYDKGNVLPTLYVPGLTEGLQSGLLSHVDSAVVQINELLLTLNAELEEGSLHESLGNVRDITQNLASVSADLKAFSATSLPELSAKADSTLSDLQVIVAEVRQADLKNMVNGLDSVVTSLQTVLTSEEGTLGMVLHDPAVYNNLNKAIMDLDAAVLEVDTVVMSIKAHPCIKKRIPKK